MKRIVAIILSLVIFLANSPQLYAISNKSGSDPTGKSQRQVIEAAPWYDPTACTGGGATTATGPTGGKLFLIGDSITQDSQIQSSLNDALKAKGYDPITFDSLASRSLSSGGSPLNGLTVFQNDISQWKDASTIIIELGTNGGISTENIKSVLDLIKQNNPNAKVYWVNVGADNSKRDPDINTDQIASTLQDNTGLGFNIIDWNTVVKQNPSYIPVGPVGIGVHPYTTDGRKAYVDTITKALDSYSSSSSISGSCECESVSGGGSTTLAGKDNKEKTWNYLISKGLTPFQAAGVMGNLENEGSFEPRLVQYGSLNSKGEVSVQGEPSSLDDNVPTYEGGYGIAQWTTTDRKNGLRERAAKAGIKPGDLGLQLDYLWYELTNGSYSGVGSQLKQAQSVEAATSLILKSYEAPSNADARYPIRLASAQKILNEYNGTSASGGAPSGCGSSIGTGTLAKIVEIAQQEFAAGADEANGRYLKYTDGSAEEWCADFVSWVLNKAGIPFSGGASSGGWRIPSVNGVQAYFEHIGSYHSNGPGYVPKPGDVAIYNTGNIQHVRFVISVDTQKGTYTGIGGNESNRIGNGSDSYINNTDLVGFGTPTGSNK